MVDWLIDWLIDWLDRVLRHFIIKYKVHVYSMLTLFRDYAVNIYKCKITIQHLMHFLCEILSSHESAWNCSYDTN